MATHTFWTPPRPLTPEAIALAKSYARQLALTVLGPLDPRLDDLARQIAYRALSYGRHHK